jgi:hypothetical protein
VSGGRGATGDGRGGEGRRTPGWEAEEGEKVDLDNLDVSLERTGERERERERDK